MRAELSEEVSGLHKRLGLQGAGWIRATPLYLLLIGVFGIILPWEKAQDFLNPVILGAYACLGIVFAAPAAAPGFENHPTVRQAGARIAVSVLYGQLAASVMLTLALISVYVSHPGRIVVGPNLRSLAECAAMGLALSVALATAAVWLSIRFSPNAARTIIRLAFAGLLGAFYLRSGWLPAVALKTAGIAFLVSIALLAGLRSALATAWREGGPA